MFLIIFGAVHLAVQAVTQAAVRYDAGAALMAQVLALTAQVLD